VGKASDISISERSGLEAEKMPWVEGNMDESKVMRV
jgi:hypothetical protein